MNWICRAGWGNWSGFGGMTMILFWTVLIIGTIYLIRTLIGNNNQINHSKAPLDLVKERYAKGEITDEEFERIKNKLQEK